MLDLQGFVDCYSMYDLVAKRFRSWGYIYAFVELALGLAFTANFQPLVMNCITLVVMIVSIVGVLQSVLNKRKIRCACLGAVFNLPMGGSSKKGHLLFYTKIANRAIYLEIPEALTMLFRAFYNCGLYCNKEK